LIKLQKQTYMKIKTCGNQIIWVEQQRRQW
jgi:hypothetical protein